MNIRFLETVIWLAELRNFRVTAERMNMTPAAISNRVSAMEQELGFKIFDRDARDVRLTEEGARFVSGARDIVGRYNALLQDLGPKGEIEGTIRIGVLPSMALTILPGIMETLRRRFPRIRVSVSTDSSATILQRLENRELDVILGFPGTHMEKLTVSGLCDLSMYWVSSPKLDQEKPNALIGRADLLRYPIISYELGTYNHGKLLEYLQDYDAASAVMHYSNSLTTTISMISNGLGIAVLPPIVIQNELRTGELRVLNVQPTFPVTRYYVVYLEAASSRLCSLISSIARDVTTELCGFYDRSLMQQVDHF
ncbi:LysR family transcriptional regulator [Limoniibacter endophyticus]|uniref:LysR family transcriptional regulator n=1 Tax=Limoniibacter endophyticus TaxID=1565040 RepID=UPI001677AE92|nr:LysR family transcriptional regulator [Limoniibacter endophyticus]